MQNQKIQGYEMTEFHTQLSDTIYEFEIDYGQKPIEIRLRKDICESIVRELSDIGVKLEKDKDGNELPTKSWYLGITCNIVESESVTLWELFAEIRGVRITVCYKDYKDGLPIVSYTNIVQDDILSHIRPSFKMILKKDASKK
jgi:hypothetical protein